MAKIRKTVWFDIDDSDLADVPPSMLGKAFAHLRDEDKVAFFNAAAIALRSGKRNTLRPRDLNIDLQGLSGDAQTLLIYLQDEAYCA